LASLIERSPAQGPRVKATVASTAAYPTRQKTRATRDGDGKINQAFRFTPTVGRWRVHLVRLARLAMQSRDQLRDFLQTEADAVLAEASTNPAIERDRLKWGCSLSLLGDIVAAGGSVHVVDSELFVSWPDWTLPEGRHLARQALHGVNRDRRPSMGDLQRLEPLFAPDMSPTDLVRFMSEARFWLEPVSALHPSGGDYSTAFSIALRNWTMPYRGRSGRSRRFVVVGQPPWLPSPTVVGLIEIGDEAPYSTERDELLALQPAAFHAWFSGLDDRASAAGEIAERFRAFRRAVLPVEDFPVPQDADEVLAAEERLLARASGRSQSATGHAEKKRLAYVVRLAHGERVFRAMAQGAAPLSADPALRQGVRAVHDLTVPRIHMEVTICGAVPPFNAALGGKLVVSFLAHPQVTASTKSAPGAIVRNLLDLDRIERLLPSTGLIALTTKGLYPGHSALYNRAIVPGLGDAPVPLRKLGETRGESTMLLGERTSRLAQRVAEGARESGRVALVYGTGGSKRMRFLESAAIECGLPQSIVHSGIRRPVYGLRFASNVADIVWRLAEPQWMVDPEVDPSEYSRRATEMWRTRWGERAASAVRAQPGPVLGLATVLENDY
jgi:hypothetical protein